MSSRYELIRYQEPEQSILDTTQLSDKDEENIKDLIKRLERKSYALVIRDIYIFYKKGYSTSQLASVYNISLRQMQRIVKEMDLATRLPKSNKTKIRKKDKETNRPSDPSPTFFNDYIYLPKRLMEYLNYLEVIKGRSNNTVNGYKIDLILLFRFLKMYRGICPRNLEFSQIQINDIDDEFIKSISLSDLYAFLSFVERNRQNNSYARARKVASIRSFFQYLNTKAKILDENPAMELESPRIEKRNPIYLTLRESKELLRSVDESYKHEKRDYCIITLFLNCGLRLSELCSINISKIKEDTLTVIGKGNKERTVYLNKACLKAISDYLIERNSMEILPEHKDALFISEKKSRISKRTVEVIIDKHLKAAGLDSNKYSPHKLRHTAATLMYKHGNVDIRSLQKILGHESVSTTQIYTHVDDDRLREAVKLNPLNDTEIK
jgi:site-specific recombinase XerD